MKYEKPQILLSTPAAAAIQARKGLGIRDSACGGAGSGHTACAYQSDE